MTTYDDPHIRQMRSTVVEMLEARQARHATGMIDSLSPHDIPFWKIIDLFNELPAASRLRLVCRALDLQDVAGIPGAPVSPVHVEPKRARDARAAVKEADGPEPVSRADTVKIMPKDVKPSSPIKMFETVQPDECTSRECDLMNCENTECATMMQVEVKNRLALIRLREWFFKYVIMSVTLLIFLVLVLFGMGVELPEGVASELFDDVIEIAKLVFTA